MPNTYAAKQAATKLNVTATTVRNWSERFGAFLSASARPGTQPERRFTEKDLTILEYVKQLKAEGFREEAIRERLAETTFQDTEVIEESATTHNIAQLSLEPHPASPDASGAPILPSVALDDLQE